MLKMGFKHSRIDRVALAMAVLGVVAGTGAGAATLGERVVGRDRQGAPVTLDRLEQEFDFRGARLRAGVSLGFDHVLVGLFNLNLTEAWLQGVDFSGLTLKDLDFTRANLTGARMPQGFAQNRSLVFRDTIGPDGEVLNPTMDWKQEEAKARAQMAALQTFHFEFFQPGSKLGAVEEMGLFTDFGEPVQIVGLEGGKTPGGVAVLLSDRRHVCIVRQDLFAFLVSKQAMSWIGPAADGNLFVAVPESGEVLRFLLGGHDQAKEAKGEPIRCDILAENLSLPVRPEHFIPMGGFLDVLDLANKRKIRLDGKEQLQSLELKSDAAPYLIRRGPFGDFLAFRNLGQGCQALVFQPGDPRQGEKATQSRTWGMMAKAPGSVRVLRAPDGLIWLFLDGKLMAFDPGTGQEVSFPDQDREFAIHDLLTGPDGRLWFTEPGKDRLGCLGRSEKVAWRTLEAGSRPTSLVDGHDGKLYFLQAGRASLGSLVVAVDKLEGKEPLRATTASLPTVELKQVERPGVSDLLATIEWKHIQDRHFHPGGEDRSRFLADGSDKDSILALARQALEARAKLPPVPNFNRKWIHRHGFDKVIGQAYDWRTGKWVDCKELVVRLTPDQMAIESVYPKSPF